MTNYYHLERFGIMREGFRCIAGSSELLHAAGDSDSRERFLVDIRLTRVDLLLLDLEFDAARPHPLQTCLEFCKNLHRDYPALPIILHSPYSHAYWLSRFFDAGVRGFVSKRSGFAAVVDGIEVVQRGRLYVCPFIANQFSNYKEFLADPSVALKPVDTLFSVREVQVLEELIRGHSSKEIARKLFISEKTVESHRRHLVEKAEVKNTAELVRFVSVQGMFVS